ncbi:AAA family ATPase [Candidatus Woesearchaeota archaeon]|nr:AAA family ATPase [Candidatus Woesearchaeota archaeon]
MAQTIGVVSIKGGVGKTTVVSNLAAVLSNDFNKKVLVVDANFSSPNLGLHLGIVNPSKTINDVLNDKCSPFDPVIEHDFGFDVIPASLGAKKTNPLRLKQKIHLLKDNYDIILIDSSPNLNDEMLAAILASDNLLVVSSPDYPTLSCTMHATKVAISKKTPIAGIVLNRTYGKDFELSVEDIEDATKVPVLAVLPHDVAVLNALSHTAPVSLFSPKKELAIEYRKLAAALINQDYNDPRLLKRLFSSKSKVEMNRQLYRGKWKP